MSSEKIIFYRLGQKFLDRQEDMPAEAKQVVYYSLAIGHHIGVIDCLQKLFECPLERFNLWIAKLAEGDARRKMQGLIKFGEINIDVTHTQMLAHALDAARNTFNEEERLWTDTLMGALQAIEAEPAVYLIAKRR